MKFITISILILSGFISSPALFADGVITNGAQVKVKNGTHWNAAGSIAVEANASIVIEGMVTIGQSLTNNNGFQGIIIKSNNDYTGSLIFNSGSSLASVEQYLTDLGSHIIGSPVIGETISALYFNNNPETSVYSFSDGNPLTEIQDLNQELVNGKGYYYTISDAVQEGVIPTFEGTLKSNDLFLNTNTNPPLEFNTVGRNLISNPYTASINWDNESIERTNIESSIWIYDSDEQKFKFRNTSGYGNLENGYIPMGQAFLIRAKSAEAQITIPAAAREHHNQQVLKNEPRTKTESNFVVLNFQQNNYSDEVWIGFDAVSTDEFDDGIDISKMFSFTEQSEVYCMNNNLEMSVNMVQNPNGLAKTIPIFFKAVTADICTVNLTQKTGLEDYNILLEDLLTGDIVNVSDMINYEFNTEAGAPHNRFLLHLMPVGTQIEDPLTNNSVKIYSNQQHIYIKNHGKYASKPKKVFIYNINGLLIEKMTLKNNDLDILKNDFNERVVIVKALYEDKIFSQKIIAL